MYFGFCFQFIGKQNHSGAGSKNRHAIFNLGFYDIEHTKFFHYFSLNGTFSSGQYNSIIVLI